MADWWIRRVNELEDPNQMQLYQLASAYWLRGDFAAAQRALERAQALGGPMDERVRADLSRFRPRGSQ
jgi:Flp pilus assembly protein TadD